jgi:probable FeS assembly SUF system protein SufT
MNSEEFIILKRDCEAVLIPSGDKITLVAGEPVTISQALGGSFTIIIHGNMARIDAANADAIGKESAAASSAEAAGPLTEEMIYNVLRTCYDPEIPVNIVDLGLVYDLVITPLPQGGNRVDIKMTLTAPGCGMGPVIQQDVAEKTNSLPGVTEVDVILVWDPPWSREMLSEAAKLELGMM